MSLRRFHEAEPPRVELARAGSAIAVERPIGALASEHVAVGPDGEELGRLSARGLAGWAPCWHELELHAVLGMDGDGDRCEVRRVADRRSVLSVRPDERARLIRDTLAIASDAETRVMHLPTERARVFEPGSQLVDADDAGSLVLLSTPVAWECWRLDPSARAPVASGPERALALGACGEAVIVRDAETWSAISLTGASRRTLAGPGCQLESVYLGTSGVLIGVLDHDVAWWDEERGRWERVGVVDRPTDLHVHPRLPMATWTTSSASGRHAMWWSGGTAVPIAAGRSAGFVPPRELAKLRARPETRACDQGTSARVRHGALLPDVLAQNAWHASLWPLVAEDPSLTLSAARTACVRYHAAWSEHEHSTSWDVYPREALERSSSAALATERALLASASAGVVEALLDDEDPRARWVAAKLAIVRGGEPALEALLISAHAAHRRVAMGALAGQARDAIVEALERAFARAATWEVKEHLLAPLRALLVRAEGDALVRRELPALLGQRSGADDFRDRERMWQLLAGADPDLARETLAKLGERNPDVRRRIRKLLARGR